MAKKITSSKAKEILYDKSVHGHPLTDKQRRFFGAIAGGAPVKAQKGKKVIIDGKQYDTSSDEYRDLYRFGPNDYGKGGIGYYDKEGRLITNKMTLPEVVISKKDKDTKDFYDNLPASGQWAFDQMTKKYGPVNITKNEGKGIFKRTSGHYNPFTNTITINPHESGYDEDTYINELAHKVQFDKSGKFDVIGDWIFNDLPDYITGQNPYDDHSTMEYEAHSKIAPKLKDEFLDYKYDDLTGENYNKFKTGGWLDSYQDGGPVESRQAGYTDIPFNYNSAWGGQFQNGGKASSTTTPTKYKWSVNDPIPVVYATKDMVGVGVRDVKQENEIAIKTKAQAEKALKEEQQKASMKQQASLSADRVPNFGPEKEKADATRRNLNGRIAATDPDNYKYNYTTGDLVIKGVASDDEWRDASFISTPELVQTAAQLTPSGRDYGAGEAGAHFFVNTMPYIAPITSSGRLASQAAGQNPYGIDYSNGLTLDNALGTGIMGLDLVTSRLGLSPGLQTLTEPIVEDLANIAGKVKSGVVNIKQAYAPPSYPFGRNLKKGKDWMRYVAAPEVQNRFGFTSSEASDWLEDFVRRKTGKTVSEIDAEIQVNPSRALRYERLVHDELFGNTGGGRYNTINNKIDDLGNKFKTWGNYLNSTSPLKGAKDLFNSLDRAAAKAIKFDPGSIESIIKEANRILAEGVGVKKTDVDVSLNLTTPHKGYHQLTIKINDPNLGWVDLGYIDLKSNTTFEPATLSNKIKQLLGKPMSSATTARIEKGFTKEMDFPTSYQNSLNSQGIAYDYTNTGIGAEAHQAIKQAAEKYNTSLLSSTGHTSGTRTSGYRNPTDPPSGEVRYLREYLNGRLQGVSDEQFNVGWEQRVKDYMKKSGKTKWTTREVELLLDSDPTLAPSGVRFKYEEGGSLSDSGPGDGKFPFPIYSQPTRSDSLFLLNNNKIIKKLLDSGKYEWLKDKKGKGVDKINPKEWKEKFEIKKDFFDNTIPKEIKLGNKKKGKLSDYRQQKGKFIGTSDWLSGGGDDYGFPMQYIHPDIAPQYEGDLVPKDGDRNKNPFVYSFGYDELAITPWDMLTPQQQKDRLKKYGTSGTPYTEPEEPSLKKKVTKMEPIPSKGKSTTPQLRTIEQANVELPAVQRGQYRTSYYDPEIKDWNERAFMSQQESDQFANEMSQRGYPGAYGNVTQRVQYQKGGTLPSLLINQPNRADSIALLNNTNALLKYYNKDKYKAWYSKDEMRTPIKNPVYFNDADLKREIEGFNFSLNNGLVYVPGKNSSETAVPGKNVPSDVFYKPVDKNKYYRREYQNRILDTRAPMQLIDKRIKPHSEMYLVNDNRDDMMYSDGVFINLYEPLAVTPWDMLNPKQQQERLKKYGVTGTPYADPNYKPESKLVKKVTEAQPIFSNRDIIPTLRTIQHPNIQMSGAVPQGSWNVEYLDPNSKKTETRHFITDEQAEEFYNDPANKASRKYSDASSVGRMQLGGNVYPVNYVPQAQRGIRCPSNVAGCGNIGQGTGVGRFLTNVGEGVGDIASSIGHSIEHLFHRKPRMGKGKKNRDTTHTGPYDRTDSHYGLRESFVPSGPEYIFGGLQQNFIPDYRIGRDFLSTPTQSETPIYDDAIVSRYRSPEMNTGEGIRSGGSQGVPVMPMAQNGLTFLDTNSPKLPSSYVIPYRTPSSELASSVGGEDGEPAFLIPTFKYGHPLEDPDAEFRKTGEHLGGPFKTWQEADTWDREIRHPYVEKGQDIPTPLRRWGKDFAMGGSIPGSVGFTYARTNSPAPSNGPYAKKTKASAQDGKEVPIDPTTNPTYAQPLDESLQYVNDWMNSPMYKQMLSNSLRGRKRDYENLDRRRKSVVEDGKINYYEESIDPRIGAESNYVGKGKSNMYFNKDADYPDWYNNILHELFHITDAGGLGIPLSDKKLMYKYATHDIKDSPFYESAKATGTLDDLKKFTNYVNAPSETRARINNLRKLMRDQEVYDPFTQPFSKDMFDKYKQLDINEEDKKAGHTIGPDPYQQLRMTYTDEEIEDMMNKISKADNNELTPIAQNGMTFYQHGLDWKPKSMKNGGKSSDTNYKFGKSKIQGVGTFAKNTIKPGEYVGKVHTINKLGEDYDFTSLGNNHNHSENPNVQNVLIGNERHLVAIKPISKGQELTSDYRLQPDLEQPEDFEKKSNKKKNGGWLNQYK